MESEVKQLILVIAKSISRRIKRLQSDGILLGRKVGVGADGTPTEYIDKVAEDTAIKHVKKSGLSLNILSEEAGFIDLGGEYTLVLDPIDGTRNAIRGIPFYSTSLAVGRNTLSSIEYGVVLNIPTGDVFIAERNRGAYLNNKRVFTPNHPHNEILYSLNLGRNIDDLSLRLASRDNVRSLGAASLEMCMVAIGALDYYMMGREYLRVTDIAASTLIVREAGGVVTDKIGRSLEMDLSLDERTSVIAACSREVIDEVLKNSFYE